MKRSLLTTLAAGALACLLLSACGGSSTATSSPTPTPAPTATLSASVLAGLVLPVQTLTVGTVKLNLESSGTGPQTRADVLDGSFDTQRDSAELDQYGWQADQQQTFLTPTITASGVFIENNTIDLVDTPGHAAQALATRSSDVLTDVGKTNVNKSGDTTSLDSATAFVPTGFDGAKGVTASLTKAGTPFYLTVVAFVHGRLLVSVGVGSFDQSDQTAAVVALAHQVETQIGTVIGS
jgi:hypothetical protein